MNRPRFLGLIVAAVTIAWSIYLGSSETVPSWVGVAPLLLGGALLLAVSVRRARSKRARSIVMVGWGLYILLAVAAFGMATLSGVDIQARGIMSVLMLAGVGGFIWVCVRNARPRAYSYHNYFDN